MPTQPGTNSAACILQGVGPPLSRTAASSSSVSLAPHSSQRSPAVSSVCSSRSMRRRVARVGFRRMLSRALLLALAATALIVPPAQAKTVWLCRPDTAADPCHKSLKATVLDAKGKTGRTEPSPPAAHPKVDCFYVYPTVSEETKPQADFVKTPSVKDVAYFQTARFRQDCRVWAPVYRQITLQGLLQPQTVTRAMVARAYADVRA